MKKSHIYLELTSEQVPVRLLYLTEKAESLQLQMVLIRYIIRMRDGRSRILKNGGAQSARQQRKRYRKPESHRKKIAGVGIDGQSWSAIAIDQEGKVLTNTPIWMDTRAQSICDRLNQEIGAYEIFKISGNSLQPSYSTAKIIWYREK